MNLSIKKHTVISSLDEQAIIKSICFEKNERSYKLFCLFQNFEMTSFVESKFEDAMEDDMDDNEEEFEISEEDDIIADYVTNNHQNIHWKVT